MSVESTEFIFTLLHCTVGSLSLTPKQNIDYDSYNCVLIYLSDKVVLSTEQEPSQWDSQEGRWCYKNTHTQNKLNYQITTILKLVLTVFVLVIKTSKFITDPNKHEGIMGRDNSPQTASHLWWTGNWTGMLRRHSRKDCGNHLGAVENATVEKSLKFLSFLLRRFLLRLGSLLYRSLQ